MENIDLRTSQIRMYCEYRSDGKEVDESRAKTREFLYQGHQSSYSRKHEQERKQRENEEFLRQGFII